MHGTFIGKIRGYNVFVNIEDEAIRCYSGTSNNAYWIGEPDEGPYWPTAMVNYDGEAKDELNVIKKINEGRNLSYEELRRAQKMGDYLQNRNNRGARYQPGRKRLGIDDMLR